MEKSLNDAEIASSEIHSTLERGTAAQDQLGRRQAGLFASLDATVADAVKSDAQYVVYTEEEERAVKSKIDRRILPLVVLSYVFNQFDRTNIGNAHVISAFNKNFGIHNNNKWTLVLSIFYVGYCLLEMPANVLQRKVGANRFFFTTMSFWGLCSLSVVYSKGYASLLVLRVLLGVFEAGYYAGIVYYLSFWYKRKEMAFRISLGMTGTLPGAIGGLCAFGLVRAKTKLLAGWQFLFMIEAIPTIIIAFLLLFFLPSFPFTAGFLTAREKAIAQARLDRDHRPTSHGGMTGWGGFKAVMQDVNVWMLMLIYVGFNIGTATSTYFLPTLINGLGFSALNSQGLTVAPYVFGYLVTVSQALHSDRTRDRGWHIMASAFMSCVGYIILATCSQRSVPASYFALFLVVAGNFSLFPMVMGWAANTMSPTSKRGVGVAFIVSMANCVSIAAPQIYFDPKDKFRHAHGITAGCLFMSVVVAFLLRTRLAALNRQKDATLAAMSEKEREEAMAELATLKELPDSDPRFRYVT